MLPISAHQHIGVFVQQESVHQVVHHGGYHLLYHPPQPRVHEQRLSPSHLLNEGIELRAVAQLSLYLDIATNIYIKYQGHILLLLSFIMMFNLFKS